MSYADPATLSPAEIIAHYVLELRGRALFLPYQDYGVIGEWLHASADSDELLLVLSDVLPEYFAGAKGGKRSLTGIRGFVLKRLKGLRMRQSGGALEKG